MSYKLSIVYLLALSLLAFPFLDSSYSQEACIDETAEESEKTDETSIIISLKKVSFSSHKERVKAHSPFINLPLHTLDKPFIVIKKYLINRVLLI